MSQEKISELREKLVQLDRRIKPLEWDSSRNQINEFRQKEFERLKEEHARCLQELQNLEQNKDSQQELKDMEQNKNSQQELRDLEQDKNGQQELRGLEQKE